MNKKISILGIFLIILVTINVIAQENPEDEFKKNPSAKNFDKLPSPTYKDLERVAKPTLVNFQRLSIVDKETYLIRQYAKGQYRNDFFEKYIKDAKFDNRKSKFLAMKFFEKSKENVNQNKIQFRNYQKSLGVSISLIGDIKKYYDGRIEGTNGIFPVRGFKDKYKFFVAQNGEIQLLLKDQKWAEKKHTFTGTVKKGPNGNIVIAKGSFDGQKVIDGKNIRFDKEGNVYGNAKKIGDLPKFDSSTPFTYIPPKTPEEPDRFVLSDAKFVDYDHYISGVVSEKDGEVYVWEKDSAKIDNFEISVAKNNVLLSQPKSKIHYASVSSFLSDDKNKKNFVQFLDGKILFNGDEKDFTVEFNPRDMLDYRVKEEVEYYDYVSLGDKGYYTLGDGIGLSEDSLARNNIRRIQYAVGVEQTGIYSEGTKRKVRGWQKEYDKKHPEAKIKVDGIWGPETRDAFLSEGKIKVTPNGGKVVVYNGEDALTMDVEGSADFVVGRKTLTTDGFRANRKLGYALVEHIGGPVRINFKEENGKTFGSFDENYAAVIKPKDTRVVDVRGEKYSLEVEKIYIIPIEPSPLLKGFIPKEREQLLERFDEESKKLLANTGHIVAGWVDKNEQLWITQSGSEFGGVRTDPYEVAEKVSDWGKEKANMELLGIYKIVNADAEKVIDIAEKDETKKIKWMLWDMKIPGVGEYKSCAGYVCYLGRVGGSDLAEGTPFLGTRNLKPSEWANAIAKSDTSKKGFIDKVKFLTAGAALHDFVKISDAYNRFVNKIREYPFSQFPYLGLQPAQLLYGGLRKGILEEVKPTDE